MIEALHTGMKAIVSVGGGGESRNCSVLQKGSSKVVYWTHARLHQQCSMRLSEIWGWRLHTVQTERCPIQRRTLQSEDQDYSGTDE